MESDTISLIIAVATFIGAVLSPIAVAIINNHYQSKRRYEEFYQQHRSDVIESYLRSIGKYIYCSNEENTSNLGAGLAEIYMYAPKSLWEKIDQMNNMIFNMYNDQYYKDQDAYETLLKKQYQDLCKAFYGFGRSPRKKKKKAKRKTKSIK